MKLSILIPSKSEPYLQKTLADIEEHTETSPEVLWREDHGVGQRALTNELAREATGTHLMKIDAHCSFSQGFDRIMLEAMEPDMTMMPLMCNLDPEEWRIKAKPICGAYYADRDLMFQYHSEWEKKQPGPLTESMVVQGSCFMLTKEKYWELNICDEQFGSWGQQGVEVGLKTWLSGGRVICNRDAFYGHWFRDPQTHAPTTPAQIDHARAYTKQLFLEHPKLPWLIDKFGRPGNWGV